MLHKNTSLLTKTHFDYIKKKNIYQLNLTYIFYIFYTYIFFMYKKLKNKSLLYYYFFLLAAFQQSFHPFVPSSPDEATIFIKTVTNNTTKNIAAAYIQRLISFD